MLPLAITALMFFFSQLVPKTYASRSPTEMALAVAHGPLSVISRILLRRYPAYCRWGPHWLSNRWEKAQEA